jgi:hypothetical protein
MSDAVHKVAQAIKNSVLNMEAQIKAFENAFIDLQRNFQSYMAVSTQLTVLKVLEDVQDLGESSYFFSPHLSSCCLKQAQKQIFVICLTP